MLQLERGCKDEGRGCSTRAGRLYGGRREGVLRQGVWLWMGNEEALVAWA